jgi:hypothetical protein
LINKTSLNACSFSVKTGPNTLVQVPPQSINAEGLYTGGAILQPAGATFQSAIGATFQPGAGASLQSAPLIGAPTSSNIQLAVNQQVRTAGQRRMFSDLKFKKLIWSLSRDLIGCYFYF